MKKAIVTGAGGLVGSEAVRSLIELGYCVYGIENDMRKEFFGSEASTYPTLLNLIDEYSNKDFQVHYIDIRERNSIETLWKNIRPDAVIHTAGQPSHDWAAKNPHVDFGVNATGTHNLIEAHRLYSPESPFCHISTSKVYGDNPNFLGYISEGKRWELPLKHKYRRGFNTTLSVDNCLHSLFGVSKLSGDLLVQEYGRYFDIPSLILRPGCVTGPQHQGVELHGFLNYLMKCAVTGKPYNIYGYEGKQVRCNISAYDLVQACISYINKPMTTGVPFNIGGGRQSACSILEGIDMCVDITEGDFVYQHVPKPRIGDHIWWISDNSEFQAWYPHWLPSTSNVKNQLEKIYEANVEKWTND